MVAKGKSRRIGTPPLDQFRRSIRALEGRNKHAAHRSVTSSPAKADAAIKGGRDPRVTLAPLTHPGLLSVAGYAGSLTQTFGLSSRWRPLRLYSGGLQNRWIKAEQSIEG